MPKPTRILPDTPVRIVRPERLRGYAYVPDLVGRHGVMLDDDGGPVVRVRLDQTNEVVIASRHEVESVEPDPAEVATAIQRSRATIDPTVDGAMVGLIEDPEGGFDFVPLYDHRQGTPSSPPRADVLASIWTDMHPRTRRRIERASRSLVVALDARAARKLAE